MNDNSAYEKEILNKIKDIEIALRYYIDKNKELEADLEYYKNIENLIQRNKELMLDKKAFTDNYGNMILKIAELEKENKKIRQWKYVIDTYADLEKLKELDLIKIEGKEYISKDKIREIFDNYSQSSLMENNTFLEFKKELLEERN